MHRALGMEFESLRTMRRIQEAEPEPAVETMSSVVPMQPRHENISSLMIVDSRVASA